VRATLALWLLLLPPVLGCASTDADPPSFEDLEVDVDADQQTTFDAVLGQVSGSPGVSVAEVRSPYTFAVRPDNGGPETLFRVATVRTGTTSRSILRARRNIRTSDVAELRRWLTLAVGTRMIGEIRRVAVATVPAEPTGPTTPRSGGSSYAPSGSGSVYVRGYYRKDGTYVRPHTRRRSK
jgi:hypothetical protein